MRAIPLLPAKIPSPFITLPTSEGCCIDVTNCIDWEPRSCNNGVDFVCQDCGDGYCNVHMFDEVRNPETGFCDDCRKNNHTCMNCDKVVPEKLIEDLCVECYAEVR